MSWKKLVLTGVAIVVASLWGGLVVTFVIMRIVGVNKALWIALVTTTAFATEGAFWIAAAVLGVSVVQARKTIWRRVTRPFRRGSDSVG